MPSVAIHNAQPSRPDVKCSCLRGRFLGRHLLRALDGLHIFLNHRNRSHNDAPDGDTLYGMPPLRGVAAAPGGHGRERVPAAAGAAAGVAPLLIKLVVMGALIRGAGAGSDIVGGGGGGGGSDAAFPQQSEPPPGDVTDAERALFAARSPACTACQRVVLYLDEALLPRAFDEKAKHTPPRSSTPSRARAAGAYPRSHFCSTRAYSAPFRSTEAYFVLHRIRFKPWMCPGGAQVEL